MKKFLRDPDRLDSYITNDMIKLVKDNMGITTKWERKFYRGKASINYIRSQHPGKKLRNFRVELYSGGGGQMGVWYDEGTVISKLITVNDWMKFIKEDSDELTKTGQKLLQEAIESFEYCVLDAQAKTRWVIVGEGAKSLQTQGIFHKLVKDTITVDSVVLAISNMRKAIKSTNVVLNMVISPDVILIPSDMTINKEKILGYNNTLTLASTSMKFGVNKNINKPVTNLRTISEVSPKTAGKSSEPIASSVPNERKQTPEFRTKD